MKLVNFFENSKPGSGFQEPSESGCLGKQIKKGKAKKKVSEDQSYDDLRVAKYLCYNDGKKFRGYGTQSDYISKAESMREENPDKYQSILRQPSPPSDDSWASKLNNSVENDDIQIEEMDMPDLSDDMIGTPDAFYDEEQRQEAFKDLQDAMDDCRHDWQKETVVDGICPECSGSSCMDGDDENGEDSCYGWGNFGCDGGEMTQNDDGLPNWAEIIKHDKRKADRDDAKANYPGDEAVIDQIAKAVKQMDDPRQMFQYMQADYPFMGRAQRSNLIAKGMVAAGLTKEDVNFEEGTIDQTFATDNIDKHDKKSKPKKDEKESIELEIIRKLSGLKEAPYADDEKAGAAQVLNYRGKQWKFDPARKIFTALDGEEASVTTNTGKELMLRRQKELMRTQPSRQKGYVAPEKKKQGFMSRLFNDVNEDAEGDASDVAVSKMIAKALGDENRWTEMSAAELYAELESENTDMADIVKDVAKMIYGVKLAEAKTLYHDSSECGCKCGKPVCAACGRPHHPKDIKEHTLEDNQDFHEEYGVLGYSEDEEHTFEAEYQGRKVKLNKPMRGDVKKFKVYVKDPKTGNVKKVNFGHGGTSAKRKTMRIRKSNPKARKSFRARHNCDNPGPKTKARYWSCRKW